MIDPGERAFRHVQYLAGEIGCRMIATPAYRAAADYITRLLVQNGFNPQVQELDFPCWIPEIGTLELDGKPLEAVVNAFSPSCKVTAPSILLSTPAELEAAVLSEHIPVLYGYLSRQPLTTKDAFYASESDHHVVRILEEKRPPAIITVQPHIHNRWPLIEDFQFKIPSVTVPVAAGLELLHSAGSMVSLDIKSQSTPGTAKNLIASHVPNGQPRIVLCAHYDTKIDTPGAWDNAGGTAILLTLMEKWAETGWFPPVELVFFGGEEYSMAVDQAYINRFTNPAGQIRAAVNLDGIGHALKTTTVAVFEISPEQEKSTLQTIRRFTGVTQADPWPESDHSWFYPLGIPTWAISQQGLLNLDFAHSPFDNIGWISPEKLDETVNLVDELVKTLI